MYTAVKETRSRRSREKAWAVAITLPTPGLTWLNHLEAELAGEAVHVGWIAHLAGVGAVKAGLHVGQRDGTVVLQDVPRPHRMTFKQTASRREGLLLIEKELYGRTKKTNKDEQLLRPF